MLKLKKVKLAVLFGVSFFALTSVAKTQQPNILWIITDDHRPDSIQAYNRATTGKNESSLGYVSSPNIDKLASEGVLFTRAYNQAPACGTSRTSMHSGRYPFRVGKYAWALTTHPLKADMALYDLRNDPLERNNIAYTVEYMLLANWFRNKLGNIVLGDGRIEMDWSTKNSYNFSNFAAGADDKTIDIPKGLVPSKNITDLQRPNL